jgi:hypothetical protein
MSLHSTLLATWLLGSGLLIVPPSMSAQVPASDSAAPAAADSQTAPADTVPTTGGAQGSSDSVLQPAAPESTATADSARATSDTTRQPGGGNASTSDSAVTPSAPSDSILRVACSGPSGPATVARDLLVVVFAPEAGAAERAAAAKSVDGTLVGPVTGEPGSYYLRVPSGGGEYQLRVASDQLIQLDMVRQVGSRACPALPLPGGVR